MNKAIGLYFYYLHLAPSLLHPSSFSQYRLMFSFNYFNLNSILHHVWARTRPGTSNGPSKFIRKIKTAWSWTSARIETVQGRKWGDWRRKLLYFAVTQVAFCFSWLCQKQVFALHCGRLVCWFVLLSYNTEGRKTGLVAWYKSWCNSIQSQHIYKWL